MFEEIIEGNGVCFAVCQNCAMFFDGKEKFVEKLVTEDVETAVKLWFIHEKAFIVNDSSFEKRKISLNSFYDELNLL